MEAIQHRVATTSSALYRIKGIKMTGLSNLIGINLQSLREGEMRISSTYRRVLSVTIMLANVARVLTPFSTCGARPRGRTREVESLCGIYDPHARYVAGEPNPRSHEGVAGDCSCNGLFAENSGLHT